MKIIALITAIVLAATMAITAVLKPPTVEVEPPAPVTKAVDPMQPKPAPVTEEEVIEETAPEEIAEPAPTPEKEIVPATSFWMGTDTALKSWSRRQGKSGSSQFPLSSSNTSKTIACGTASNPPSRCSPSASEPSKSS